MEKLLFIFIIFVFFCLYLLSFFGNYEEKEKAKDYEYYKQITNRKEGK
jgi:hypothetical protein